MKKILGILICMLLITTIVPTGISINNAMIPTPISTTTQASGIRGWTETQKILASDGSADDRFGASVMVDDTSSIVGAYFDDIGGSTNAGSAYIFTYSGGTWTQQAKVTANDYAAGDEFGFSVSISGDYAIVGAPYNDANGADSGSAYIFHRVGTTWTQQAKLSPGDPANGDEFGRSVDIDGDYAIVGTPGKNSNQGFSYIFVRSGTTWSQHTKIGATGSSHLGCSVSISNDTVVMGAYGTNSNTGAAHIYQLIGTSWYGKGTLTSSDGIIADLFGTSVSIDKDTILIGAPGHDISIGGEGAAYVFEKPVTGWMTMTETTELTATDADSADNFGTQVSLSGNYSVISSPDDDDNGTDSGSAYIFSKTGTNWLQNAKLTASDGTTSDYYGWSVSIQEVSTQYIQVYVGAYADDNSNGNDAGSAYFYQYINNPPTSPTITGPTTGKINIATDYNVTATDPDEDQISYFIDWGDGTNSGWIGPYSSGEEITRSHTWSTKGTYLIKAKAKDVTGDESDWGTLSVTMPCSSTIPVSQFWEQLFQRFPNAFPILRHLMGC
jgi:hypothetical protein